MIAAAHSVCEDFVPHLWVPLEDPRGPRVLASDRTTTYVISLLDDTHALDAQAAKVAGAVLRTVLPADASFSVPRIVATTSFEAAQVRETACTLVVADPLPGVPVSTQDFVENPALVDSLAQLLATLHACDAGAVADAGLVTEEPQEVRERLLDRMDRAASTGKVPPVLLQRWEDTLDNASVWHFLPTPIHGLLDVDAIRTDSQQVVSLSDVHRLSVGDPAVDLAAATELAGPDHANRLLEAYLAQRKVVDPGLVQRIELLSEFVMVDFLLAAVDAENSADVAEATRMLHTFAEVLDSGDANPADSIADSFVPASPVGNHDAEPDGAGGASDDVPTNRIDT